MRQQPVKNPPNPYESRHQEFLGPPPMTRFSVYEERSGSIISKNDSPDIPFKWSVNPYRGCQHACAYCYARPYHEFLGYGAGSDFDTRIVIKPKAPELLQHALRKPGWKKEVICFSGVTDCYQPLEASYEITRRCLEVCNKENNPFVIVTRSFLIIRDIDIIAPMAIRQRASVRVSIPFISAQNAALIEPQAPPPKRRIEMIRRLTQAGIPVGVLVSPVIPGLNDEEIPAILEAVAEAGAVSAHFIPLRLPGSVEAVFLDRLQQAMPLRAKRIINRIRDMRGGAMTEGRFGARMRGQGEYWQTVAGIFDVHRKKAGLSDHAPRLIEETETTDAGRDQARHNRNNQQMLFDFS
ncbi:MAG: PA0069 family radical SAM protein [Phycisphaerae bacterium]